MKKLFPALMLLVIIASCKSEKQKLADTISNKEKELMADSLKAIDRKKATDMIALYKDYAVKFPDDTLSPEYLFKAGDIANGIGSSREAIAFYKQCAENNSYRKRAVALFLEGFILENQLKDYFKARGIYNEFLEKYPDHPLTDDVKYSLQNIGKSPEDLIREFEKNAAAADSLHGASR